MSFCCNTRHPPSPLGPRSPSLWNTCRQYRCRKSQHSCHWHGKHVITCCSFFFFTFSNCLFLNDMLLLCWACRRHGDVMRLWEWPRQRVSELPAVGSQLHLVSHTENSASLQSHYKLLSFINSCHFFLSFWSLETNPSWGQNVIWLGIQNVNRNSTVLVYLIVYVKATTFDIFVNLVFILSEYWPVVIITIAQWVTVQRAFFHFVFFSFSKVTDTSIVCFTDTVQTHNMQTKYVYITQRREKGKIIKTTI